MSAAENSSATIQFAVCRTRPACNTQQYLDYLSWHCIDGTWRITAKSFHVEQTYEAT